MIKVSVDEAHAFDMLAILDIKIQASDCDKSSSLRKQRENLWNEILDQLGYLLTVSIFTSNEYDDLYKSNQKIFKLIDQLKEKEMDASVIDEANYERFLAKRSLQYWFFGIESMTEKKIGYEGMETNRE